MPDSNGYPTEAEIQNIREWETSPESLRLDSRDYTEKLLKLLKPLWHSVDWGWTRMEGKLYLSTGGWSGNEELIEVLRNTRFWRECWQASRRGGHYTFLLPTIRRTDVKIRCTKCAWTATVHDVPSTSVYTGTDYFCPHCGEKAKDANE